ncbi:DNA-3-methyladenine glycosylase I [Jiella mangrovi]|uniref:DNA-3-methyladenine glycosylase I n=1 Tax=Jiella mangrovi TaxID=2821407 RepID=A0ABS4BDM1_9HYPH|nr:DNA-3-methyladenine glycosylase I [Jiella mangrovi]MBP0614847.1 DNA-3-methyladenine glycosylase I [Jiella mangrovi]
MAHDHDIADGLVRRDDGSLGCAWHGADPLYRRYHDEEWGRPCADDDRLYEKLCLEGFQAGLSWLTILRKREAFRAGFDGFSIERVARMGEADVERLVKDPGIVRHRGKIASAINNARRAAKIQEIHGSLARFLWSFEPGKDERPGEVDIAFVRATPTSAASTRLSKALKNQGFTFVGATTVYAFMQSMGFVNDHIEGCSARAACEAERAGFRRPVRG